MRALIFVVLFYLPKSFATESQLWSCELTGAKKAVETSSNHSITSPFQIYLYGLRENRNYTLLYQQFLKNELPENSHRSYISHRFNPADEIYDSDRFVEVRWNDMTADFPYISIGFRLYATNRYTQCKYGENATALALAKAELFLNGESIPMSCILHHSLTLVLPSMCDL